MITNTVSDVSSTNGGTGQPASATLNVVVSSRQHHLAFDPASHTYGHVRLGGALSQTFTLANTGGQGTGALTITVITVSGPQRSFTITATTCHRGLGPRKSCTVTVQFAPTTDGEITGKLTAVGKKPTAMATADLTGTGMRATS
jgi:hypothetical protein